MATQLGQGKAPGGKYEGFVETQLARAESRIRALDLATGLLGLLAATLAYAVLMALCDWRFDLPSAARQALFLLYLLGAAAYLWLLVLRPLRRRVNPYYAARQVEQTLPGAKNSVLNWVDLHDEKLPPAIRGALGQRAARDLARADLDRAISGRRTGWVGGITGLFALAFIIVFVSLGPRPFFHSLGRAFAPFSITGPAPTRTQLTLLRPEGGDAIVTVGRALPIVAEITGRLPDPNGPDAPRVLYRYHEGDPYLERQLQESGREWAVTFPAIDVQDGFWYRVAAGDAATPEYRVTVRATPQITDFRATYHYRPYVARVDHVSHDRPLQALRGTEVLLRAQTNRTLREARVEFEGKDGMRDIPAALAADDPEALQVRFVVEESGQYRIHFTAVDNEAFAEPRFYPVIAIPDQAPRVELTKPGQDVRLPANGLLRLEGKASDDIGIKSMTLRARVLAETRLQARPYRSEDKLRLPGGGYPLSLDYQDFLDLATVKDPDGKPFRLKAGMELEYWLEASDACDYPRPNVGESPHFRVKIVEPQTQAAREKERREAQEQQKQHNSRQDDQLKKENEAREQERRQERERQQQEEARRDEEHRNDGTQDQQPSQEKGQSGKDQGDSKQPKGGSGTGQDQAKPERGTEQGNSEKSDKERKLDETAKKLNDLLDQKEKEQAGKQQQQKGEQQGENKDERKGEQQGSKGEEKGEAKGDPRSNPGENKDGGKGESKPGGQDQHGSGQDSAGSKDGQHGEGKEGDSQGKQTGEAKPSGAGEKNGSPSGQKPDGSKDEGKQGTKAGAGQDRENGHAQAGNQQGTGQKEGSQDSSRGNKSESGGADSGKPGHQPERAQAKQGGAKEGQKQAGQDKSAGGSRPADRSLQAEGKRAGSKDQTADGQPQGEKKDRPAGTPKGEGKGAGKDQLAQKQPKSSSRESSSSGAGDQSAQGKNKPAPGKAGSQDLARAKPDQQGGADQSGGQATGSRKKPLSGEKGSGASAQGSSQKDVDQLARDLNSGDPGKRDDAARQLNRIRQQAKDPAAREAAERALEQSGQKSPQPRPGQQGEQTAGKEPRPNQKGPEGGSRDASREDVDRLAQDLKSGDPGKRDEAARQLNRIRKEAQDPGVRELAQRTLEKAGRKPEEDRTAQAGPQTTPQAQDRTGPPKEESAGDGKQGQGARETPPGSAKSTDPKKEGPAKGDHKDQGKEGLARGEEKGPGKSETTTQQPDDHASSGGREQPAGRDPSTARNPGKQSGGNEGKPPPNGDHPAGGNRPGEGMKGDRRAEGPPPPETSQKDTAKPSKPKAHRAAMMQLDRFEKLVDKKTLKQAGISDQEYRAFLEAMRQRAQREAAQPDADENLPAPQEGALPSIAGRTRRPPANGRQDDVKVRHRGQAPPGYGEAYADFLRRIAADKDKK